MQRPPKTFLVSLPSWKQLARLMQERSVGCDIKRLPVPFISTSVKEGMMILEWYLLIILHNAPFGALQGPLDSYQSCQRMADDLIALGKSVETPTQVFCAAKQTASLGEANKSGIPCNGKSSAGETATKTESQEGSQEAR